MAKEKVDILDYKMNESLVDVQDYKPNRRLLAEADKLKHNTLGYESEGNIINMSKYEYMNDTEKKVELEKLKGKQSKATEDFVKEL